MCGEHRFAALARHETRGSSPHVRGAPGIHRLARLYDGIIPACAGSTKPCVVSFSVSGDHPRMCGEHMVCFIPRFLSLGSSPHVRGAHCNYCNVLRFAGIIPACAGSTPARYPAWQRLRDHPRMCGEHTPMAAAHTCLEGSSPHVRGALQASRRSGARPGIIPACAGSTKAQRCGDAEGRDHPRMCGEHDLSRRTVALPRGSSPHVRGARPWRDCRAVRAGIIPACAGSTYANTDGCILSGDHPRMCGEHVCEHGRVHPIRGSSPHVRGAPNLKTDYLPVPGIIPACAGSTLLYFFTPSCQGIIPACAGSTRSWR